MNKPNINLLRHNAKQILKANYGPDWHVTVRKNGDIDLYNPHEDVTYYEGNLYKDDDVRECWSRYCVERMLADRDVTFESWRFHTKTEALDKLIELIKEDNGQQINLLDNARVPRRVVRVTCGVTSHFIEIMPRFFTKRGFSRLSKVQEELDYPSIHCEVVQGW